jgi:serine/threonine protein kinase
MLTLHQVHRDIKLANILVNHRGDVKLSDFGIVAELLNTQDNCNTFVGTTVYMSPERINSQDYSYPADIWSLGMCIYTLATGAFPFKTSKGYWGLVSKISDEPAPELDAAFDTDLRTCVAACLDKEPASRCTVEQLLVHPFVATADAADAVLALWPVAMHMYGQKTAKKKDTTTDDASGGIDDAEAMKRVGELNDILELFILQHPSSSLSASTGASDGAASSTVDAGGGGGGGDADAPVVFTQALRTLSTQLGMPHKIVLKAFNKLFKAHLKANKKKIKKDRTTESSRRERPANARVLSDMAPATSSS